MAEKKARRAATQRQVEASERNPPAWTISFIRAERDLYARERSGSYRYKVLDGKGRVKDSPLDR